MTVSYETMSNNDPSFDWYALPPGQYKMKGGELFRVVDETESDCKIAADNFLAALRKLV